METLRSVAAIALGPAAAHPFVAFYLAAIVITVGTFAVQVIRFARRVERTAKTGESVAFRRVPPPGLRVSMGALFVLLPMPVFVDHLGELGRMVRQNPAALLVLVFPLAGIGLLLWGLVPMLRPPRPGRLELDTPQPQTGGVLAGRYVVAGRLEDRPRVRVRLVLQEVRVKRWGSGERQLFETPRWSATKEELPRLLGAETEIPFRFEVPARLPGSSEGERRHEWLLVFEGAGLGSRRVAVEIAGEKGGPTAAAAAGEGTWGVEGRAGGEGLAGAEVGALGTPAEDGQLAGPMAAPELAATGRFGLGAVPGQPQGLGAKLASLAASLFVLVFPLLMWFAFDGDQRPWLDLRHTLPPLLLKGLVALGVFGTPVLLLVRSLQSEGVRVRRANQLVAGVIVLDSILTVAGVFWVATHGVAGLASLADSFERVGLAVLHGLLGMFVWLGAYAVLASLVSLLRGSDERSALA